MVMPEKQNTTYNAELRKKENNETITRSSRGDFRCGDAEGYRTGDGAALRNMGLPSRSWTLNGKNRSGLPPQSETPIVATYAT